MGEKWRTGLVSIVYMCGLKECVTLDLAFGGRRCHGCESDGQEEKGDGEDGGELHFRRFGGVVLGFDLRGSD